MWSGVEQYIDPIGILIRAGAALCALFLCLGAQAEPSKPLFSTEVERCIIPAAQYHGINYYLLRAVLSVESGLKKGVVSRNSNGTVDVGVAGTNSIHFRELGRYGITPSSLQDVCVSSFVAAWRIRALTDKHGNNMASVSRYHSATPCLNRRYQILLSNELKRYGVMSGPIEAVPKISTCSKKSQPLKDGGNGILLSDDR